MFPQKRLQLQEETRAHREEAEASPGGFKARKPQHSRDGSLFHLKVAYFTGDHVCASCVLQNLDFLASLRTLEFLTRCYEKYQPWKLLWIIMVLRGHDVSSGTTLRPSITSCFFLNPKCVSRFVKSLWTAAREFFNTQTHTSNSKVSVHVCAQSN